MYDFQVAIYHVVEYCQSFRQSQNLNLLKIMWVLPRSLFHTFFGVLHYAFFLSCFRWLFWQFFFAFLFLFIFVYSTQYTINFIIKISLKIIFKRRSFFLKIHHLFFFWNFVIFWFTFSPKCHQEATNISPGHGENLVRNWHPP